MSQERFKRCIDACFACAAEYKHCASECLKEENVRMLGPCVQLDMECSLVCLSTAQLMMIGGENAALLCGACAEICVACAEECQKQEMDHCLKCAEECRNCAEECRSMTLLHV